MYTYLTGKIYLYDQPPAIHLRILSKEKRILSPLIDSTKLFNNVLIVIANIIKRKHK